MASQPGTEFIGERAWARDFDKPKTLNDPRARQNAARSELPAPAGPNGEIKAWTGTTTSSLESGTMLRCSRCGNRDVAFTVLTENGADLCGECSGSDLVTRSNVTECACCEGTGLRTI
jgi:hypothetical protein